MLSYTSRANQFAEFAKNHSKKAFSYSLLRGGSFIVFIGALIGYFNNDLISWLIVSAGFLLVFTVLISRHKFHEDQKSYFDALVAINNEEQLRSRLELSSFETGIDYLEDNHPNQHDLDTFGSHSLYQLINRCSTSDGKDLLAQWLSVQPSDNAIKQRQEAIQELSQDLDWLQELQAKSRISVRKKKKNEPNIAANDLLDWSKTKSSLGNKSMWWTLIGVLLLGIATTTTFIILETIPYQYLYGNVFVNALVLGLVAKKLSSEAKGIDKAQYLIASYEQVIKIINKKTYGSELAIHLKEQLSSPLDAEISISQLRKISHRISARANMLYIVADLLFLPDFFLLMSIYQWKKANEQHIKEWLDAIHEFEVLMSIASYSLQHDSFTFPELTKEAFTLNVNSIGHPLIPNSDRVTNDYTIQSKGSVDIVTGSNMSGKSTFQRTLGVNLILARLGGPVCASKFEFSNMEVFTSMRTRDNLSENTSSFYAELKRISQLLNTVELKPTFFLLDEILKGTNSEDRHLGAIALAEKLSQKQACGLISTHDLSLGQLEQSNQHVRNYSFNSQIEGNKIKFDYKLTPGPCKSFNASQLMRNMGIID